MLGETVHVEHSSLHVKRTGRMWLSAEWRGGLRGHAAANVLCDAGACARPVGLGLEILSLPPMVKLQLMQGQGTNTA